MSQTAQSKPGQGGRGRGAPYMAVVQLEEQLMHVQEDLEESQKKKFGFQKLFWDKKLPLVKFHPLKKSLNQD